MPTNQAEYHFVCRNTPAIDLAGCELRFTEDELAYLRQVFAKKPETP